MLKITIPASEGYDQNKNEFILYKEQTLSLEHSLISLSKWESKYCKHFLDNKELTDEEIFDYIKFMVITPNVTEETLNRLTPENIKEITDYIAAPMTATTFSNYDNRRGNREIITSELIYYWMTALNIPFECQKWHLNRLLTLVRVCGIKNSPQKKMSRSAIMSRNNSLNAARRKALNTKG